MFEDISKKRDDRINNSISNIIKNSYELVMKNKNLEENDNANNDEIIVNNFFEKLSHFISRNNNIIFGLNKKILV